MKELNGFKPEVALIVGSGLGGVTDALTKPVTIPYSEIPGFPQPRVAGHAGKLFAGELGGKRLLIFSGRFHHYEGRPVSELVAPVVVSDEIMPGVVSLPHGWGHTMKDTRQRVANAHAGVNANAIIDEGDLDVPSATTILNGVPVEIEVIAA